MCPIPAREAVRFHGIDSSRRVPSLFCPCPSLRKPCRFPIHSPGELTWFTFDEGVQHRTLDSLSTRAITGVFSYDSERQDTSDIAGLLRIAISGDGFFFDAGEEGVHRRAERSPR